MGYSESLVSNNMLGVAGLLSFAGAFVFSGITCLGLGFMLEGSADSGFLTFLGRMGIPTFAVSAILALLLMAALVLGIIFMYKSTVSRNSRKSVTLIVALGMAAIFVLCSPPFFKFMYIVDHKEEIKADVRSMYESLYNLDKDYTDYVDKRMDDLRHKRIAFKSEVLTSLRRRLMPENFKALQASHREWLKVATNISVFNISTPHNMRILMNASRRWIDQYAELSSLSYMQEKSDKDAQEGYAPFTHARSADFCDRWMHYFRDTNTPDAKSLFIYLLLAASTFILYFSSRRPRNRATGTHL